MFQTEDIVC